MMRLTDLVLSVPFAVRASRPLRAVLRRRTRNGRRGLPMTVLG